MCQLAARDCSSKFERDLAVCTEVLGGRTGKWSELVILFCGTESLSRLSLVETGMAGGRGALYYTLHIM